MIFIIERCSSTLTISTKWEKNIVRRKSHFLSLPPLPAPLPLHHRVPPIKSRDRKRNREEIELRRRNEER
jgi:hypothetical protein